MHLCVLGRFYLIDAFCLTRLKQTWWRTSSSRNNGVSLLSHWICSLNTNRSEYLSLLSYKHMLCWVLQCVCVFFFWLSCRFIPMFVHPAACLAGTVAWNFPGLWLKRPSQSLFVSTLPGRNAQMPPTLSQWDIRNDPTWIDSLCALKRSSAYLRQ